MQHNFRSISAPCSPKARGAVAEYLSRTSEGERAAWSFFSALSSQVGAERAREIKRVLDSTHYFLVFWRQLFLAVLGRVIRPEYEDDVDMALYALPTPARQRVVKAAHSGARSLVDLDPYVLRHTIPLLKKDARWVAGRTRFITSSDGGMLPEDITADVLAEGIRLLYWYDGIMPTTKIDHISGALRGVITPEVQPVVGVSRFMIDGQHAPFVLDEGKVRYDIPRGAKSGNIEIEYQHHLELVNKARKGARNILSATIKHSTRKCRARIVACENNSEREYEIVTTSLDVESKPVLSLAVENPDLDSAITILQTASEISPAARKFCEIMSEIGSACTEFEAWVSARKLSGERANLAKKFTGAVEADIEQVRTLLAERGFGANDRWMLDRIYGYLEMDDPGAEIAKLSRHKRGVLFFELAEFGERILELRNSTLARFKKLARDVTDFHNVKSV